MSGPSSSTVTTAPVSFTPTGQTTNMYQLGMQRLEDLYAEGDPAVYTGDRYVTQDPYTTKAIADAYKRATGGSTLLTEALTQQEDVLKGTYLQNNPFFEQMLTAASKPITTAFQDQMAKISSQASLAGRYGSGAAQQLQSRATSNLADALANMGGSLAYQNYAAERARQEAAATQAPALAASEYGDIEKLLRLGQIEESYTQAKNLADMQKFQEEEMAPYTRLQTFLSGLSAIPTGQTVSTQYTSDPTLQSLGAALGAGAVLGSDGSINIPAAAAAGLLTFLGLKK